MSGKFLCACFISALHRFVASIENLACILSCVQLKDVHVKLLRMKHLLLLDNSPPMVTPLQALDLKEVNKHTVPYALKT
jgi:hypothetical protein